MTSDTTPGENYVFLGGVPRSGTTLIQRCMAAHPEIYAGPEFDFIPGGIMDLRHRMTQAIRTGRISQIVRKPTLDDAFRDFIDRIFQQKLAEERKSLFCEKTPASALYFPELANLFPGACLIAVIRDPRDIANSMRVVRDKIISAGKRPPRFTRSVTASVQEMNRFFAAISKSRKASHPVHLVHYEDVLCDPERELRRICGLLNIDFSQHMLEIETSGYTAPENSDEFWYSQDYLQTGIEKRGVVSERVLGEQDIRLVERYVRDFDFLHRYDLKPGAATARDRCMWAMGKMGKSGIFMPRKRG